MTLSNLLSKQIIISVKDFVKSVVTLSACILLMPSAGHAADPALPAPTGVKQIAAPVANSGAPPAAAAAKPAASVKSAPGSANTNVKPTEDPAMAPPVLPPGASSGSAASTGIFAGFLDPFDYDPRGRRDPFAQPIADVPVQPGSVHGPLLPLQMFDVAQLRVVGILWNVKSPKAMIKDPNGKMHIVGPYTKVGPRNGYIAAIREGEIVVVETIEQEGRLVSSAQVVKIAK